MAGGSKTAVYTAIGGNSLVMVAKFVGFGLTGSGSMLAEGIHSLADVGNQTLLAIGMTKAAKAPDEEHPEGFGREAFIWALMSAVGIFFLGCGVTVMHGVQSLLDGGHHGVEAIEVAIGILIFSLVVEGLTFVVAIREVTREAKKQNWTFWEYMRKTQDPFGVAVVYEDGAAVLGVLIALFALIGGEILHVTWLDAVGSIAVGALLGLLAVNLILRNRDLLIGKAVGPMKRAEIARVLEQDPAVESVAIQRAVVDGSDSFRIAAEIDIDGRYVARHYLETKDVTLIHNELDTPDKLGDFLEEFGEAMMQQVGEEIDRIEARLAERLPKAKNIDLEPD